MRFLFLATWQAEVIQMTLSLLTYENSGCNITKNIWLV